jgi:putative transposase
MPTELAFAVLKQALTLRQPAPGLVIHADRDSQHTTHTRRQRIEDAGMLAS